MYYEPLQDDEPSYAEQCRRAVERKRAFGRVVTPPRKVEEAVAKVVPAVVLPRPVPPPPVSLVYETPIELALALAEPAKPGEVEPEPADRRIWIHDVQRVVCDFHGMTLREVFGPRRTKVLMRPRHIAAYLCTKLTNRSLTEIGKRFNRDHTTILAAIRRIEKNMDADESLRADIERLSAIILGGATRAASGPTHEVEQAPDARDTSALAFIRRGNRRVHLAH